MLSDNSNSNETNKKPTKPQSKITPGVPPPEQEHLPCPRCSSTNTKFCYYNNYNFSQPRHFCKSCRRYWTQGGTLRDIPVGGGTRKTAKRSRTSAASSLTVGSVSAHDGIPLMTSPILMQLSGANVGVDGGASVCGGGSFTSLLNTQGHGLLSIGGLGLGIGSGLEDMGFGFGRGVWSLTGLRDGGVAGDMSDTWQLESTENGFVGVNGGGGDCFSWPDLAISTPGNVMK